MSKVTSPECTSAWQFAHKSTHLSSSCLIIPHDRACLPLIPNNFSSPFKWWKFKAAWQRLYPHRMHFPPLYAIACVFRSCLRWLTRQELHFPKVCPLPLAYSYERPQTEQTRLFSTSRRLLLCLPYGEQERQYFLLPSTLDLPSIFIRVGNVFPHFLHLIEEIIAYSCVRVYGPLTDELQGH
jgi:hypothetical protein